MENLKKGEVFVLGKALHPSLRSPVLRFQQIDDSSPAPPEAQFRLGFEHSDTGTGPIIRWSSWVELAHAILEKDFQLKLEEAA